MDLVNELGVGMVPDSWTSVLATFETDYLPLTFGEAQAFAHTCDDGGWHPDLSTDTARDRAAVRKLTALRARLDESIASLGGTAFVKLSTRSAKDVVYEDGSCAKMRSCLQR